MTLEPISAMNSRRLMGSPVPRRCSPACRLAFFRRVQAIAGGVLKLTRDEARPSHSRQHRKAAGAARAPVTVLAIAWPYGFNCGAIRGVWSAERGMAIIESAEKKLQEARRFLNDMRDSEQRAFGGRETFDHSLSAFLSAAMSVRGAFHVEEDRPLDKTVKKWKETWEAQLTPAQKCIYDFMRKDRSRESPTHERFPTPRRVEEIKVGVGGYSDKSGTLTVMGSPSAVLGTDTGATISMPQYSFDICGSETARDRGVRRVLESARTDGRTLQSQPIGLIALTDAVETDAPNADRWRQRRGPAHRCQRRQAARAAAAVRAAKPFSPVSHFGMIMFRVHDARIGEKYIRSKTQREESVCERCSEYQFR